MTAAKYSKRVAKAYEDVSIGDYYVDPDGHWLTLKGGYHRHGGQIVHEWSAADMLAARSEVQEFIDSAVKDQAARAMLKALKELREWDALQGTWDAPCFDHMRAAIKRAEAAGITTGEDE